MRPRNAVWIGMFSLLFAATALAADPDAPTDDQPLSVAPACASKCPQCAKQCSATKSDDDDFFADSEQDDAESSCEDGDHSQAGHCQTACQREKDAGDVRQWLSDLPQGFREAWMNGPLRSKDQRDPIMGQRCPAASESEFVQALEALLGSPGPTAFVIESIEGVSVFQNTGKAGRVLVTMYPACGAPPTSVVLSLSNEDVDVDFAQIQCPRSLERGRETKCDPELAELQKAYLNAYRRDLLDEAAAVSEEIAAMQPQEEVAQAGHFEPAERSEPTHHQVGYKEPQKLSALFQSKNRAPSWSSVANKKISFHFQDDTLLEVAQFFHQVTGLTVRVEETDAAPEMVHFNVECRDISVRQALRVVLGSRGLCYRVESGTLILSPVGNASAIEAGDVEDSWKPE